MSTTETPVAEQEQKHTEIERRFLVSFIPENLDDFPMATIEQGYIIHTASGELRVRKKEQDGKEPVYTQTIKRGTGQARPETEIVLTHDQFHALWPQTTEGRLEKKRYDIPLPAHLTAELNIFQGALLGMVEVEVEFGNQSQADAFIPPEWFGREVTQDERYQSAWLAKNGLPVEEPQSVQSPDVVVSDRLRHDIEWLFSLIDKRLPGDGEPPLLVFAAGRTSAGKTSAVTEQIVKRYGEDNVTILPMDDYFGGDRRMERLRQTIPDINWDHPMYLDIEKAKEHIRALAAGQTIHKPSFNFKTGEPDETTTPLSPNGKKIIIIEGIHALHEEFKEFDGLRTFVDISLHGSIIRRLLRDVARTGRDPAAILSYYLHTVERMYQHYVAPRKPDADVILLNEYDPKYEAARASVTDEQVKFRADDINGHTLQKIADHIASVDQTDYYFTPKDGENEDEIFRIRLENGQYFLTYKGPRTNHGSIITRPKLEFLLDEETAHRLIYHADYGPILKKIDKHRDVYYRNGVIINLDEVSVSTEHASSDLGKFLDIKFQGKHSEEIEEELRFLTQALGVSSARITEPYILMAG